MSSSEGSRKRKRQDPHVRAVKNREAAQASRERKKAYEKQLETQNKQLMEMQSQLMEQVKLLQQQNQMLMLQLQSRPTSFVTPPATELSLPDSPESIDIYSSCNEGSTPTEAAVLSSSFFLDDKQDEVPFQDFLEQLFMDPLPSAQTQPQLPEQNPQTNLPDIPSYETLASLFNTADAHSHPEVVASQKQMASTVSGWTVPIFLKLAPALLIAACSLWKKNGRASDSFKKYLKIRFPVCYQVLNQ